MIAALTYSGSSSSRLITLEGKVTDEKGSAIPDVLVGFWGEDIGIMSEASIYTDSDGNYSISIDLASIPSIYIAAQGTEAYWTEVRGLDASTGNSQITLDFVLYHSPQVNLTLGTVVMVSTQGNSTLIKAEVNPSFGFSVNDSDENSMHFSNPLNSRGYQVSRENSTYVAFGGTVYVHGVYYGDTHTIAYWKCSSPFNVGLLELKQDLMKPEDLNASYTIYTVSDGETLTISSTLNHSAFVPEMLTPQSIQNMLERNITLSLASELDSNEWAQVNATVSITPLTQGVHSYMVYIEDDFIIHIWEMPNSVE
jgi:hypothetical protein